MAAAIGDRAAFAGSLGQGLELGLRDGSRGSVSSASSGRCLCWRLPLSGLIRDSRSDSRCGVDREGRRSFELGDPLVERGEVGRGASSPRQLEAAPGQGQSTTPTRPPSRPAARWVTKLLSSGLGAAVGAMFLGCSSRRTGGMHVGRVSRSGSGSSLLVQALARP